ncbi:oxidoreductase [Flavobacteriales bacterium]|nr:oxidoreductase [Flavobacteriales bacterium]
MRHKSIEGSWRALEAPSEKDVWLAGSTGEWVHVRLDGNTSSVQRMQDRTGNGSDSLSPLNFRGIAVTNDAVLATAIGSPAHIQRARIKEDGMLELPRQSTWTEQDSAAFMDAIVKLDDKTIIAMGDPLDSCLCVVRSDDGGKTWQRVPCTGNGRQGVPLSMAGEAAFAASNGNLAAAGDTVWMLSGGGASRVYRSTDRGQNWKAFPTPLLQGGTMTGGFSMDFADAFQGIIWGGDWEDKTGQNGRGAVTRDGGETWTLISEGQGPGYASSVRYRPGSGGQQLALVGTPGGLDLSEDGGHTWRHFSDSAFYTARFSPQGGLLWLSGQGKISHISCQKLGW